MDDELGASYQCKVCLARSEAVTCLMKSNETAGLQVVSSVNSSGLFVFLTQPVSMVIHGPLRSKQYDILLDRTM